MDSTKTFLAIVGTIIVIVLLPLVAAKYRDCMEHGGKACPCPRYTTCSAK